MSIRGLYYYEQHPIQFAFSGQVPAITQDVFTELLMFIYFIMKLLKNNMEHQGGLEPDQHRAYKARPLPVEILVQMIRFEF